MGSSYKWGESCARTMQLEREKGCVGKGASGCMPCMEKKMWGCLWGFEQLCWAVRGCKFNLDLRVLNGLGP